MPNGKETKDIQISSNALNSKKDNNLYIEENISFNGNNQKELISPINQNKHSLMYTENSGIKEILKGFNNNQ